jgi:hypothetical protein
LARERSIRVFVVGVEPDLDYRTLQDVTGIPSCLYLTADAADLRLVYRALVSRILCP